MQFLYIMDPMCGWCYGFQPQLDAFLKQSANSQVTWVMGGLAPDNDQPMDAELRQTIASYWHQIEGTAKVPFNHDYWRVNTPYRSTYPACRAVIAAESMDKGSSSTMVKAIQKAYYRDAENPSLEDTLVTCASVIGLSSEAFRRALRSDEIEQTLREHLSIVRQLQVSGFPALFYIGSETQAYPLTLGYCQSAMLEQRLDSILDDARKPGGV